MTNKKPWTSPTLTTFGTVDQLTRQKPFGEKYNGYAGGKCWNTDGSPALASPTYNPATGQFKHCGWMDAVNQGFGS